MYPIGLYELLNVSALQTLLGNPVRVYPFGDAPPEPVGTYCVHQLVSGTPSNCIDEPPDSEDERIQFTVWGESDVLVVSTAHVLRETLQVQGYVISYQDAGRDPETKRYGYIIDWARRQAPFVDQQQSQSGS